MPEAIEVQAETPKEAPRKFILPALEGDKPAEPEAPAVAEVAPSDQNKGEQATPAESGGEKPKVEDTPEQAEERAKKREGARFGRKLDKAYRERAEAQAKADLLAKELEELRKPKVPEGEPRLEQFDYDPEKYATAKADYAKKQAEKELTVKQQSASEQQYRQKLASDWEAKVDRAEAKYNDFHEIVGEITPDIPLTAAIFDAENGEEIAYYLGKNPKEADRIARLNPLSQIREIGRLEAKLALEPEKPKAPSKAPAPINPLSGAAPKISDTPAEDDNMAEWIRKRQRQVHGKR